jgi:pimeloyl-ACP methyl ester carboxylesterase
VLLDGGWAIGVSVAYDVTRASKRAWRGTNASIRALGDEYLTGLSIDAGEHDVIRETNAVLTRRVPSARNVRVDGVAHFPWLERPDVFTGVIHGFYRQIAAV